MKGQSEDQPPNSRIFILHNKDLSRETLENAFSKYGKVEDVWPVVDNRSGESKGVTYIKYSKMSEAAAAVEAMNGQTLDGTPRPLKVIIANSREQGSRRDDNETERLLRLFILIPKDDSVTEASLEEYFSQFGNIDYVLILRDKDTNANKGFAYIKYHKIFDAAKALEECDPKYKAILARPREKRDEGAPPRRDRRMDFSPRRNSPRGRSRSNTRRELDSYPSNRGRTRLLAFVSSQLSEKQVYRLFDLVPGLEYLKPGSKISYRTQQIFLEYSSPQTAEYAVHKLNGFEYPIGEPILVKPDQDRPPMYYA